MAEQQNPPITPTAAVTDNPEGAVDVQKYTQNKPSHWQLVIDQTHVSPAVINWSYNGSGTEEDPYVVVYIENDSRNPLLFPRWKKWMITLLVALVSLEGELRKNRRSVARPCVQTSFMNTIYIY
jgi:hypothetical protein